MKSIKKIFKTILLLLFFGLFYQINAGNPSFDASDVPATLLSLTTSSNVFTANESATLSGEMTDDGGRTITER